MSAENVEVVRRMLEAAFERSDFVRRYLGDAFTDLYAATRRGEMQEFNSHIPPLDYAWYLTTS